MTERGKPVALLAPIQAAKDLETLDAKLSRLAARGLLTLPTRRRLKRVRRVEISGRPLSDTVIEDRR